tara:strand:- start:262 stop:429 length:168 start_codon:yes stop_codon:yes gene_type:complete
VEDAAKVKSSMQTKKGQMVRDMVKSSGGKSIGIPQEGFSKRFLIFDQAHARMEAS